MKSFLTIIIILISGSLILAQEWIDSSTQWHYERTGQWTFGYSNLFVNNVVYDSSENIFKYILNEKYITFSRIDCEKFQYYNQEIMSTYVKDSIVYLGNDTIASFKKDLNYWNYSRDLYTYEFKRNNFLFYQEQNQNLYGFTYDLIVRVGDSKDIVYEANDFHFFETIGFIELPLYFWDNYPEIQDAGLVATPRCVEFKNEILKLNSFESKCDTIVDCFIVSNNNTVQQNIQIYPNPLNSELNITSNELLDEIILYSSEGVKISQISPKSKNEIINFSNFPNGLYYVKIFQNDLIYVDNIIKINY